jgi:hypothetical protein
MTRSAPEDLLIPFPQPSLKPRPPIREIRSKNEVKTRSQFSALKCKPLLRTKIRRNMCCTTCWKSVFTEFPQFYFSFFLSTKMDQIEEQEPLLNLDEYEAHVNGLITPAASSRRCTLLSKLPIRLFFLILVFPVTLTYRY